MLCEWKDGKFEPCSENITATKEGFDLWGDDSIWKEYKYLGFCPFCGADIRKPEDNHCKYRSTIMAKPQCSRGNECISVSYKCNRYEPKPDEPMIIPQDIKCGIYIIYWKNGGTSVAAIGMMKDGSRWISPTNWITTSKDQHVFNDIKKLELICT